ncbi:MAG: 2-oxo acid dehydrogenase subunit E2 [Lachnospiraceae bacterium]|nr:2-oxo acid dehydrogenase subunit E2 [Lachnospiraceae bacterium]
MRRWGDRRDGKLIRDIDSMHYIMPLMYPNRCDNEAYMTINVELDKTEQFLKEANATRDGKDRLTIFQVVIAAALKTVQLRPQMNRFIAHNSIYQRNNLTAAFTVKKEFADDGEETLARVVADENDTLDSLAGKISDQIEFCKSGTDQSTESMNFIMKLPFKRFIGAVARWADRRGLMPKSVIATDPYQCSIVLSNLGSIGMNIGYHHLMNWGTNSIFIIIGKKHRKAVYDAAGNQTMKRYIQISLTIDERIADGYYYSKSIRLLKKLIENPELLQTPLNEEVLP